MSWSPEASDYLDSIRSPGRPPINDELTSLDIDRRFKWQLRQTKKRRCIICGKKLAGRKGETNGRCVKHADAKRKIDRAYQRKRFGWKPRKKNRT